MDQMDAKYFQPQALYKVQGPIAWVAFRSRIITYQFTQDAFMVIINVQTETTQVSMVLMDALNPVMVDQSINKIQVSTKWLVAEDMTLARPKLQLLTLSQTKLEVESIWTSLTFKATLLMILEIAKQDTK